MEELLGLLWLDGIICHGNGTQWLAFEIVNLNTAEKFNKILTKTNSILLLKQ